MIQTILGSSGQIGRELVLNLHGQHTLQIRLVSRNPQQVNDSDELYLANLLDATQTMKAVEGSSVAYLTVGLPTDAQTDAVQKEDAPFQLHGLKGKRVQK